MTVARRFSTLSSSVIACACGVGTVTIQAAGTQDAVATHRRPDHLPSGVHVFGTPAEPTESAQVVITGSSVASTIA